MILEEKVEMEIAVAANTALCGACLRSPGVGYN